MIERWWELATGAPDQVCYVLLGRRKQPACLSITVRGDHIHPNHGVRPLKLPGWFEPFPIDLKRLHQGLRREMRGEGIGQTQHGRELGTIQAGAQDPDRNLKPCAGHRLHNLPGLERAEEGLQFQHVLGKVSALIGSRRSARNVR